MKRDISYPPCWIFHFLPGVIFYPFHSLPWAISYPPCWIFHCFLGAIFYHFIPCPGLFHTLLIAFFIACQVRFFIISFLALGHFITTSLHFSLPARCNLFIYFIPCPGPFHTHPVGFFIACQVWFFIISFLALGHFIPPHLFLIAYQVRFFIHFNPCPGPFHFLPWVISYPPCCIFHCLPGAIFCSFQSLPWAISYPPHSIFHCLPGVIFYHFISCPAAFHTLLIAFFITCQVQFIYPFHSLPWAISYPPCWIFIAFQVQFFIHFIPCPGLFYTLLIAFFIA